MRNKSYYKTAIPGKNYLREAHFIKNVILVLCADWIIAALSLLPGIARLADFGSELMMAMLRPKVLLLS